MNIRPEEEKLMSKIVSAWLIASVCAASLAALTLRPPLPADAVSQKLYRQALVQAEARMTAQEIARFTRSGRMDRQDIRYDINPNQGKAEQDTDTQADTHQTG